MHINYEQPKQIKVIDVMQTHDGKLEIIKDYYLETTIRKKEIYACVDGKVDLVSVVDL